VQGPKIRPCEIGERPGMLAIINAAAQRYNGVIPADCWRDPYTAPDELHREIAAGVEFWGAEADAGLIGVMGAQEVKDVLLIRHAYVAPAAQGLGIGGQLLDVLCDRGDRPILIGTWAAATWAIGFYERRGFSLVPRPDVPALLRTCWTVPDRQIAASVVLANASAALQVGRREA
jgi:GNAT superfamily N-acetyltransferase